jgi:hypothetical protein
MTDAAKTGLDRQMTVAHGPVMQMSLPYLLPPAASKETIKAVRFDAAIGKWTDAAIQTTLVGPHSVTALVSGRTLFTVLALEGGPAAPPTAKSPTP